MRRLITPRTASQLMRRYETFDFKPCLPAGTLVGMGTDGSGLHRAFYWTPTGTNSQARALAKLEIDIVNAREVE